MGLISHLRLVNIERDLLRGIKRVKLVLADTEEIRARLENLDNDKDVKFIEKKDIEIINLLSDAERSELKRALEIVHSIAAGLSDKRVVDQLEQIFEHIEITEELEGKEESAILSEFRELSESAVTEDSVRDFFGRHANFFKAKPHKRLGKKIMKFLKQKSEEVKLTPGPVVREVEIRKLKDNLKDYFRSRHFRKYIEKLTLDPGEITVGLFGSLVTGFASNESRFRGKPSDFQRVSDVDIGIIVDSKIIMSIGLGGRHLVKRGIYFGPYFEETAAGLGPFMRIFEFIRRQSFAGRNDRKIGIIVVDRAFFENNLSTDRHIIVFNSR